MADAQIADKEINLTLPDGTPAGGSFSGAGVSGPDFVRAWQRLDEARATWNARVAGYDAVIIPSVASRSSR